ncbi:hypothetical protein IPL68_01170 [Candidatus Saccharibacteria bacterium]|nr:MAG: hypothetical protein IPL68_01170 [Candidatus Saccharibacteria bacterium]
MAPETQAAPVLPVGVVGMIDLGRLIRELERLEAKLSSDKIRTGSYVQLPKLSALMDQLAETNKLDLRDAHARTSLLAFLKLLRKEAPRVHMSFSADPTPDFLMKLTTWLRTQVHPHVLVAIGLQPGIGAGCVLRTTNHYFDMSLRKTFTEKREILMKRLRESNTQPTAETQAQTVEAPA